MGRIMSFDQDGQIVRDFDKSEYDFLRRYGRTPDEVMAENARLRELVKDTLMQPRDYCQKYDIEYDSWDSVNEHLDARLRELGVEVEP